MKTLLLLASLSLGCEIHVGLIPFAGNWFVFGDREINAASALCPGEDNTLLFEMGPYHPTSIMPSHRETVLSTLLVDPLGRMNSYKWSVSKIIARTYAENTLSYPGDEIVKEINHFNYLIYGRPYENSPTRL